ncbi:MAG: ACP phosphodiesterase [Chitinophagaceae bacterium]
MNYLAHAYLSFRDPEILVGNIISDFVKGKKKFDYPKNILKGIELHRAIDQFTDQHDVTRMSKEIFRPYYRLYSGAFTDIVYDHYLANDLTKFNETQLLDFSQWVYITLNDYQQYFPEHFSRMYPYMKQQNWLYNYRLRSGMEKSFGGLVRRAAYLTESEMAFRLFEENYERLNRYYQSFFPELYHFAFNQMKEIQLSG